jgi:uncharacterized protein YqfA (UPF0365 family)
VNAELISAFAEAVIEGSGTVVEYAILKDIAGDTVMPRNDIGEKKKEK